MISLNPVHFDKLVLRDNDPLPENINLKGALAITRDSNHETLVHKLIYLVQKVHSFIMCRKVDCHLAHGVLIVDQDRERDNHVHYAHSVLEGLVTESGDLLDDDAVTELVIYLPRSDQLRDYLVHHANQTVHTDPKLHIACNSKKKTSFSIVDLVMCFFHNRSKKPSQRAQKRLAYAIADLLKGEQLLDKDGEPRSYFCTPYVTTLLQTSIVIDELKAQQMNENKTRDDLAVKILKRLEGKSKNHSLSHLFKTNPIMSLDARFLMSAYAAEALDSVSSEF